MNNISMLLDTIVKNSGITLDKHLNIAELSIGYAVSYPNSETIVLESDLNESKLLELFSIYKNKLNKNNYLGIWIDQGKVYFDLSCVINDLDQAIELGNKFNQLAIFDFKDKQVIKL